MLEWLPLKTGNHFYIIDVKEKKKKNKLLI
jgi:hypothetical protein